MKAKEKVEKTIVKLRFAVSLTKALNKSGFSSFRDLASHVGLEPAHIQRIAVGKVDVVLSTIIALVEGLNLKFSEFSQLYDETTDAEIREFSKAIESRKKNL